MQSLRYRNPLIANSIYLQPGIFNLDSIDPSRQVFVYISFVKPGRHTFCVENETGEIDVGYKKSLDFVQNAVTAGKNV